MSKIRPITKEADEYHILKNKVVELIKDQKINTRLNTHKFGISGSTFYYHIKNKSFSTGQLIRILEVLLSERRNY